MSEELSEELSEAELAGWRNLAASGDRGVHLDRVILRRLLATLDRATERAEANERVIHFLAHCLTPAAMQDIDIFLAGTGDDEALAAFREQHPEAD